MPKRKAVKGKAAVAEAPAVAEDQFSDKQLDKILAETLSESREGILKWMDVQCPHCGEDFEVCVDPSEEGHEMIQDCQVCCKSVQLSVEMEDGVVSIFAYRS